MARIAEGRLQWLLHADLPSNSICRSHILQLSICPHFPLFFFICSARQSWLAARRWRGNVARGIGTIDVSIWISSTHLERHRFISPVIPSVQKLWKLYWQPERTPSQETLICTRCTLLSNLTLWCMLYLFTKSSNYTQIITGFISRYHHSS